MKTGDLMITFQKLAALVTVTLFFIVLSTFLVTITSNMSNPDWFIFIIVILFALFVGEFWKFLNGRRIIWDYLMRRDKWLFILNMVILMGSIAWPLKMGLPFFTSVLYFSIGYISTWAILFLFGSREAKKHLLWPNPTKE